MPKGVEHVMPVVHAICIERDRWKLACRVADRLSHPESLSNLP